LPRTKRIKDLVVGDVVSKKDFLKRFSNTSSKKRWNKDKGKFIDIPISKLMLDYKYEIIEKKYGDIAVVYVALSKRQKIRWIEIEGKNTKKSYFKKHYISSPNIINVK
jgi:hypothetical protein|tara:strand:- start:180 stop:503 length:324 start_codon:yes stop_codon:yes gene_type:complete